MWHQHESTLVLDHMEAAPAPVCMVWHHAEPCQVQICAKPDAGSCEGSFTLWHASNFRVVCAIYTSCLGCAYAFYTLSLYYIYIISSAAPHEVSSTTARHAVTVLQPWVAN